MTTPIQHAVNASLHVDAYFFGRESIVPPDNKIITQLIQTHAIDPIQEEHRVQFNKAAKLLGEIAKNSGEYRERAIKAEAAVKELVAALKEAKEVLHETDLAYTDGAENRFGKLIARHYSRPSDAPSG